MKTLLLLCFWVLTLTRASAAELTIYAAASLIDVMQELASLYERQSGDKLVFNFKESSNQDAAKKLLAFLGVSLKMDNERLRPLFSLWPFFSQRKTCDSSLGADLERAAGIEPAYLPPPRRK
jgi:hypothetical protein